MLHRDRRRSQGLGVYSAAIQPAWQPALNSLASMAPSLFVSTIVKSTIEGTTLSLEIAAPFGDTMVQTAWHLASSRGSLRAACDAYSANHKRRVCQDCQFHCSYSYADECALVRISGLDANQLGRTTITGAIPQIVSSCNL
jgi:hypothetical protein